MSLQNIKTFMQHFRMFCQMYIYIETTERDSIKKNSEHIYHITCVGKLRHLYVLNVFPR